MVGDDPPPGMAKDVTDEKELHRQFAAPPVADWKGDIRRVKSYYMKLM